MESSSVKNFLKLQNLLVCTASGWLRKYFVQLWNSHYKIPWEGNSHPQFQTDFKPFFKQCGKVQRESLKGNISLWDLPLLVKIIKYFQEIHEKTPTDCGFEYVDIEKLEELKEIRNKLAHQATMEVDNETFTEWWGQVVNILRDFGLSEEEIQGSLSLIEDFTETNNDDACKTAEELKEKGNSAYLDKQYEKAIKIYTEAIDLKGLSNEILGTLYSNRALCHIKMNLLKEAKRDSKSVITLRPCWVKGYARLAKIYELSENYFKAFWNYSLASTIHPENKEILEAREFCKMKWTELKLPVHNDPRHPDFREDENDFFKRYGKHAMHFFEQFKNICLQEPVQIRECGHWYRLGTNGYTQNYSKAVEFYGKAAAKGDSLGLFYLAEMMLEGLGITRDVFKALELYKKAANMPPFEKTTFGSKIRAVGVPSAQHKLGLIYQEGLINNPVDIKLAISWYEKALGNGCRYSPSNLGYIYCNSHHEVFWNVPLGISYYKLASYMGNVGAMENLAGRYKSVGKHKEAQMWYKYAIHCDAIRLQHQKETYLMEDLTKDFKPEEFRSKLKEKVSERFPKLMEEFNKNVDISGMIANQFPKTKIKDKKSCILEQRQAIETAGLWKNRETITQSPTLTQKPLLDLSGFNGISLNEILLLGKESNDKIFEGRILKLRVIEDAFLGAPSIKLLVQDASTTDDEVMRVFIYKYPQRKETQGEIGYGCVFSLMNPYLRLMKDGYKGIRVDDTNLLFIHAEERNQEICRYCQNTLAKVLCRMCFKAKYCDEQCLKKDNELQHRLVCNKL